jgi:hypothetical protein
MCLALEEFTYVHTLQQERELKRAMRLCWRNLFDSLFQGYGHRVTHSLPHRLANVCPHRQFMCAIAQSHERTPKGVAIDFAPDLYQAARSKELD